MIEFLGRNGGWPGNRPAGAIHGQSRRGVWGARRGPGWSCNQNRGGSRLCRDVSERRGIWGARRGPAWSCNQNRGASRLCRDVSERKGGFGGPVESPHVIRSAC